MKTHPDRTQMPQPAGFEKLNLQEPEKILLDNGLPVVLFPGSDQEVTRLDLIFDAGTAFQEIKLQAAAVNDLLGEGTQRHSSFRIAEILDFHGAYTDYFLTKDTAGITLYGLSKYYDRLLPLMAELITEAVFPDDELALFIERRKQEFLTNKQKVRYMASQGFNKQVFGEHSAYGQVVDEEDFGKLHRRHLLDFYRSHYCEQPFLILLSGKTDKLLLQNTNRVLGQLPQKQNRRPFPVKKPFVQPGGQKQVFIEKQGALQSAIRMGNLSISRNHPDFPGLNLLNTVLGGYFGSRLMRSIREEKGYTYGIYSAIQNHRHAGIFGVATEVNAIHTVHALEEIKRQMHLLCEEKVGDEELQTVKNYVYGAYLRNFDGPFQLADRFKKSAELQLPFVSYKTILEQMMEVSAEELLSLAGKYLDPGKMKTLVAGDVSGWK